LSFTYLVSAALVRNVRPTDLTRNTSLRASGAHRSDRDRA
jgi:hypothetical protein